MHRRGNSSGKVAKWASPLPCVGIVHTLRMFAPAAGAKRSPIPCPYVRFAIIAWLPYQATFVLPGACLTWVNVLSLSGTLTASAS